MALELRQQLKLSQQLVMTPQLQQAIKLLQLSRLELMETVQNELLENPFLEEKLEDLEPVDARAERPEAAEQEAAPTPEIETVPGKDTGSEEDMTRNADWENYLGDFSSTTKQVQMRESESPDDSFTFEARLSSGTSLEGHLFWQLRLSPLNDRQMAIGEMILGNLEPSGYLAATVEELAEMVESEIGPVEDAEVEAVLREVQRFDPVGVAARSAQECLLVQVDVLGYDDPVLVELIKEHLEDLEKRRYKPLARKFKLTMEQIKEYLDLLQTLEPLPGASYGNSEPFYISPDVYVYRFDEEYVILLNEDGLPKLELNAFYMDNVQACADKEKEYLQDKMRSAVWLMKSLYQRQRTLYKVVEAIVRHQREFFDEGVTHLRPLILKDIADDISMHESTVSRITTSKYVATPHGVFELKFFFNSALGLDDGGQVGSESVKALIKQLIGDEDPKRPLSDERIAELLKDSLQVNIARRTVAKYRTALDIPSSSKRKQFF